MTSIKIPLTRPYMGDDEKFCFSDVVASGWLAQGPRVRAFEMSVAEYTGAAHAIACSSCTSALHVAVQLHRIGPGDEVIVPSYTWIATANVIRMVGATPVFVDIDLATFNIDPEAIEQAITSRTRALMPVHQFGLPADMDRINDIAARRGLAVIEDAACAIGSRYRGKPVGSLGNVTCFSFHPRKLITTGEGGMLVMNDTDMSARARILINQGASMRGMEKHRAGTAEALLAEEFHEIGYNYRMTDLQGQLGSEQMKSLDRVLSMRRARAERYTECLANIPYITVPAEPTYCLGNWQSYAIRISDESPARWVSIVQALLDAGIQCRPAYMACHVQPIYREIYPDLSLPHTEEALRSVIILPLYPQMTDEEQDFVVRTLSDVIQAAKRA
jgi:perosamine synthetase